jgi:hypothetical protein
LTDTPADISNQTSDKPEDWQESDDLPVAQVRELFVVFVKAFRSFQLYDEQNPVRKRFVIHQPTIKVIADNKGAPLATPVTVDLSQSERTIVRTTDAQKYGIRVSDYLI